MQSRFSSLPHLPSKALIAIPCIIGIAAAVTTSMTRGRGFKANQNQDSQNVSSVAPTVKIPPQPVVPAQPLAQSGVSNSHSSTVQSEQAIAEQKSSSSAQTSPSASKQAKSSAQSLRTQKSSTTKPAKSSSQPTPSQSAVTVESFAPVAASDIPQVPIRVAIVHDAQNLTIATSDAGVITDARGQILGNTAPQSSINVSTQGEGVQAGTIRSQGSLWIRPKKADGLVFVNGNWYRGVVQLIPQSGNLLAVNHVEMQSYLYSVVGAEMYHHWPAHALKAQAIAARSYALVHIVRPASPHFDLGSTQRWQAYKGVNSEANSTVSAVDKTRGIVISHNGGIVESLYASSEDLVRDAHRGFGMSQYGARDLASKNLDYRQILSRFYPGTQLSLLQTQ